MSVEAITWALNLKVERSTAKFVLVAMANCANNDMTCWPSVQYLSDATCQDRKTVLENIKRLKEYGYIADTTMRRGQSGQVIVYQLKNPENGTVPKTGPSNAGDDGADEESQKRDSSENGTVPKTDDNSPVFSGKQSRFSAKTGPKTGHGTVKNPKEPKGNPKKAQASSVIKSTWKPLDALLEAGVDKKTAEDWLTLRKGKSAAVTETVLDQAKDHASRAGMPLAEALKICCLRGWAGYKAEWLIKHAEEEKAGAVAPGAQLNRQEALEQKNRQVAEALAGGGA